MDSSSAIKKLESIGSRFSDEQLSILNTTGGVELLAVAGSGKTFTMTNLIAKRILTGEIQNQSSLSEKQLNSHAICLFPCIIRCTPGIFQSPLSTTVPLKSGIIHVTPMHGSQHILDAAVGKFNLFPDKLPRLILVK